MNKYLLLITLLLCSAVNLFASETFLFKNASKNFDVKIEIEKCEKEVCHSAARVYLLRKNQTRVFQSIQMPEMYLHIGADKKATQNLTELYGENHGGVHFEDFNFDGAEDLALRNGSNGVYGADSHDVLLFSKATGKFVKNAVLTELASENDGLFTIDKKQKTLETSTKNGCCWYQIVRYGIVNNRPVKIYVFTEDMANGDKSTSTTEMLVNGKWRKTVKTSKN